MFHCFSVHYVVREKECEKTEIVIEERSRRGCDTSLKKISLI
jgi:hypothetical protein